MLIVVGLIYRLQASNPAQLITDFALIGGAVSALAGLGFGLGQTLTGSQQTWIHRETKNLVLGVAFWSCAAAFQSALAIMHSPVWVLGFLQASVIALLVMMGSMYTLFALSYIVDFINSPKALEHIEFGIRPRRNLPMHHINKFLHR